MIKINTRKILTIAACVLAALFLVLSGVLYYALGTTSGMKFIVSKVNSSLSDILEIKADIEKGSVINGFKTSSYFEVNVKDIVIVRADSLDLHYSVMHYLTHGIFEIDRLYADKLEVELLSTEDDKTEEVEPESAADDEPFRLDFLVKIAIDDLKLNDFAYLSDIVDVRVKKASLILSAHDDFAAVTRGVVENPTVHLKLDQNETPPEVSRLPEILTYDNGNGAIEKITDVDLPLTAALYDFKIIQGRYYQDGYDTGLIDVNLDAIFEHTLLTVYNLRAKHQLGEVLLRGTMDFVDYYNMNFVIDGRGSTTDYTLKNYEGALYGLKGEANLKGSLVDLNLEGYAMNSSLVLYRARMNTLSNELPCSLLIKSDNISYPFVRDSALSQNIPSALDSEGFDSFVNALDSVETNLSGDLQKESLKGDTLSLRNFNFSLDGALFKSMKVTLNSTFFGHGFSKVKLNLDSDLTLNDFNIHEFKASGLLGNRKVSADIAGLLSYKKGIGFDGSVNFSADDAGDLSPVLKGSMVLDSAFSLSYDFEELFALDVEHLNGAFNLNSHPAQLTVSNVSGDTVNGFTIDKFTLVEGNNQILLNGTASASAELNGSFNIEELNHFADNLKGSLIGRVRVFGEPASPSVRVAGRSKRISYDDISIGNLVFDSSVDLSSMDFSFSVITDTIKLAQFMKPYRKCSVDLSGNLEDHRLTLSCGRGGGGSYVSANGGLDGNTGIYKGNISNMMLVSNLIDPIFLKNPVSIAYDTAHKSAQISPLILTDGTSVIKTTELKFSPNNLDTSLALEHFDLNSIDKFLPEKVKLKGHVSLNSDIKIVGGVPNISAELTANGGMAYLYSVLIPYSNTRLKLNVSKNTFNVDMGMDLKHNLGSLAVNAMVSDPYGSRRLDGSIKLKDLELDLFTTATQAMNSLKGKANIDARLGGSLEKPLLNGDIRVNGSADPKFSIGSISNFDLKVKAQGDHGLVDGVFTVNESDISLTGGLSWAEAARGKLRLKAQKVPIMLLTYGEAFVDVDTMCDINEVISVTGEVNIPAATIRFNNLENTTIAPSKDEIFVDSSSNLQGLLLDKKKSAAVNNDMVIDVKISMGKDVRVDAMGVKAEVLGSLAIKKASDSPEITGSGKIYLDHARADMYGHKFIINTAEVIFKRSIDNPGLNVEVVADPDSIDDDVVVGVKVKGSAEHPQVNMFSKPAMSENEILSYLLYGHGLEKNTSSNTDESGNQLLIALGLGTTTGLVNSVVGIFGMNSFQLGSSGSGDETQVEIQTYVTNRLRLSYGYGIYNSVNEFKVRYELVRKLYAEFVSSIDHSVDLIYSFETN